MNASPRSLRIGASLCSSLFALLVCLSASATPQDATAAAPADRGVRDSRKADEHDRRFNQFFTQERYQEAVREAEMAYRYDPDALFLFNQAQALRRLNQLVVSRDAFRRYLAADPHDQKGLQRTSRSFIKELDFLIARQEEARRPVWRRAWFWGVLGSAAVAVGAAASAGLYLGLRDDRLVYEPLPQN